MMKDRENLIAGYRQSISDGFQKYSLPLDMKDAVERWVINGISGGDFLKSLMLNKLSPTIYLADINNRSKLQEWVEFCVWFIPGECWGTEERVANWKGLIHEI